MLSRRRLGVSGLVALGWCCLHLGVACSEESSSGTTEQGADAGADSMADSASSVKTGSLGPPCDTSTATCECTKFDRVDPAITETRCVPYPSNVCDMVVCKPGTTCSVQESSPAVADCLPN